MLTGLYVWRTGRPRAEGNVSSCQYGPWIGGERRKQGLWHDDTGYRSDHARGALLTFWKPLPVFIINRKRTVRVGSTVGSEHVEGSALSPFWHALAPTSLQMRNHLSAKIQETLKWLKRWRIGAWLPKSSPSRLSFVWNFEFPRCGQRCFSPNCRNNAVTASKFVLFTYGEASCYLCLP